MTPSLALPDLSPALPEMVLAAAAMALLILGVWRGEGSTRLVSWLAIGVLVLVLWMGCFPNSFLRPIQVSVDHLVRQVTAATDAAGLRRASLP